MRRALMSERARAMLIALQMLVGFRGVKRIE
jgi:hypothetical protein